MSRRVKNNIDPCQEGLRNWGIFSIEQGLLFARKWVIYDGKNLCRQTWHHEDHNV